MRAVLAVGLATALLVAAHGHHDELTEEQANAPVDAILWIHMVLQATVWGILFPVGMILGLSRSRWHVPLQVDSFLSMEAWQYLESHRPRDLHSQSVDTFSGTRTKDDSSCPQCMALLDLSCLSQSSRNCRLASTSSYISMNDPSGHILSLLMEFSGNYTPYWGGRRCSLVPLLSVVIVVVDISVSRLRFRIVLRA